MLNYFRRSMKNTLAGMMALQALFAAGSAGMLALVVAGKVLDDSALDQLESLSQAQEDSIYATIEARWRQLDQLTASTALQARLRTAAADSRGAADGGDGDPPSADRELAIKAALGDFAGLWLLDGDGNRLASSDSELGDPDVNASWLKEALSQHTVSNPFKRGSEDLLRVSTPVRTPGADQGVGVLVGLVAMDEIYAILSIAEGRGETGESYLMTRDGLVLSPLRFVPDAQIKARNTAGAFNHLSTQGDGGGRWQSMAGHDVLGFIMYDHFEAKGLPWVVVAELGYSEALAGALAFRDRLILLVALLIGVAIAGGYWIAGSLSRPVAALAAVAARVGKGDLTAKVEASGRIDEIGALEASFATMTESLAALIGDFKRSALLLSGSSSEIAATARQSAASASEQASTITEISATTEEINQTGRAAAANANEVVQAAESALATGQLGLEQVAHAVDIIDQVGARVQGIAREILQLSEQNNQIGEIIESVNELAEQSNLLAVNASIEAAKAGEQGRGFAVVASEVRNLAEQSRKATKQIRTLLNDIQRATHDAVMATEEGTKKAQDGSQSILRVREVVTELADVLQDNTERARQIAGASMQQATGIADVTAAIDDLASAGRETAAGSKQLQTAAEDLNNLALDLTATVSSYKLAGDTGR